MLWQAYDALLIKAGQELPTLIEAGSCTPSAGPVATEGLTASRRHHKPRRSCGLSVTPCKRRLAPAWIGHNLHVMVDNYEEVRDLSNVLSCLPHMHVQL